MGMSAESESENSIAPDEARLNLIGVEEALEAYEGKGKERSVIVFNE